MTRGQCTAGTHRLSPTKGHFSSFRKCNNKIHETYKIHENKNGKLGKIGQQRNMLQSKEQDKAPEEQLSEVDIGRVKRSLGHQGAPVLIAVPEGERA